MPKKRYSNSNACSFKRKKEYSANGETCYTKKAIQEIAMAWNQSGGKPKISKIRDKTKDQLYKDLQTRMTECDNEWCWLEHPRIKKLLNNNKNVKFSFGPAIPPGQHEWLRTSDIELVGKQLEFFYPHFYFMGAVPIDFQKIYKKYLNLTIKEFQDRDKHYLGVVFNTDPSTKDGKHWISLFIDLKNKKAYFFDSVGEAAPPEVKAWIKRKFRGFQFIENKNQHQFKNSECGIYSLHFLDRMASGVPFEKIEKKIIKDDEMNKNRKIYFNPFVKRE